MKKIIVMMALTFTAVSSANLLVDPGFEAQPLGLVTDGPDIGTWKGFGFNSTIVNTMAHGGSQSVKLGANTTSYANLRQSYKPGDGPEAFENMDWVFGAWVYYDSTQAGNAPATDAFTMECIVTNNWNIHLVRIPVTITPAMLTDRGWTYIEQIVTAGAANLDPTAPDYLNKVTNRATVVFSQNSPGQTGTFYVDDVYMDRANHWFDPTPSDGAVGIYPSNPLTLNWVNPEPNVPSDDILVDVVLASEADPGQWVEGVNKWTLLNDAVNAESADAYGLLPQTIYYWQITATNGSDVSVSPLLTFTTSNANQVPTVDAGSDLLTYLSNGSVDVTMAGSVTDEGSTLNNWTFTKYPATIADPVIQWPDALNTVVTLTEAGEYTLTLTADDGEKVGTDSMMVYVGVNPCDAARRNPNGYTPLEGDADGDCQVTLADFALIARDWMADNSLVGPVLLPSTDE